MKSQTIQPQTSDGPGQGTESPDDIDESLSQNEMFEMLSNRRRRFTLHYLQGTEQAELSDISEQVAAWENEKDQSGVTSGERKCVYTSLQQFHLPKMADKRIVEFDDESNTVELSESADDFDSYLAVLEETDFPWSYTYLGISCLGAVGTALSALGVLPFAAISVIGWVTALLASVMALSLAHMWYAKQRSSGVTQPPEVSHGGD